VHAYNGVTSGRGHLTGEQAAKRVSPAADTVAEPASIAA
jgi:hypothetical protein